MDADTPLPIQVQTESNLSHQHELTPQEDLQQPLEASQFSQNQPTFGQAQIIQNADSSHSLHDVYASLPIFEVSHQEQDELEDKFKKRLGLQLSSAYSAQEPLFTDQFSSEHYAYSSLKREPFTFRSGRLVGAPNQLFEFKNWLRAHDPDFVDQHDRMCALLKSITSGENKSWTLQDSYGLDVTKSADAQETRAFLEWLLAGAIIDSGLVCILGPRGSGKSHMLRRVLHQLAQKGHEGAQESVKLAHFREGGSRTEKPLSLLPTPYLPLRIIYLQALQTQDPFDLATYILNDLREIVKISEDDETAFGDITAHLQEVMQHLGDQSEANFQSSRLRVLKEHYSKVLAYLGRCMTLATKKFQLVLVVEDFDLLAGERQTFLYNLIDIMSRGYADEERTNSANEEALASTSFTVTTTPITAVMLTSRLDSFSLLEKRVASRFPQRQIILNGPTNVSEVVALLLQHLLNPQVPIIPQHQLLIERRILHRTKKHQDHESDAIVMSSAPVDLDDPERHVIAVDDDRMLHGDEESSKGLSLGNSSEYGDDGCDEDLDGNLDTGADDEFLIQPLQCWKDVNSKEFRLQLLSRQMWLKWNNSVLAFFEKPSTALVKAMNDMADATLCLSDYFQVMHDVISRIRGDSFQLHPSSFISCSQSLLSLSATKIQLGRSCSILQLLLIVEMDRLEQQIKAGIEKSGSPFVDFDLPSAAKAIDMAAMLNRTKGKRSSDGTLISSGPSEPRSMAVKSDKQSLKFFHFERVYHEYSHWVSSDNSLKSFKFPKEVVRKAFDGLLQMRLVAPCSENRYHHQIRLPLVTPLSAAFQSVKLLVSSREIKEIVSSYPEELPELLKTRLLI